MKETERDPAQNGAGIAPPRRSWQPVVAAAVPVILVAVTLGWLLCLLGEWGFDDPYVTYRYADNLMAGRGLVYNAGEKALSTVSPLYALVLAGLGRAWRDVPKLSNAISLISVAASAFLLMRWGVRGRRTGGMVAGLLLCTWPLVLQTTGLERALLMALGLAGLLAVERERLTTAAAVLALAGMLRPEGLLFGAVAAGTLVLRRRRVPWRAAALYVAPVAFWYGALWLISGSLLPTNLTAKQQQARMTGGLDYVAGFVRLVRQYGKHPLYWLHGAMAIVGLGQVVARARHWRPLVAWTALYSAGYATLGVSPYFWYYAMLVPGGLVLVGEGAAAAVRGLARLRLGSPLRSGLAGALVLLLVAPPMSGTLAMSWRPDPRLEVYREIGTWLRDETPAAATVGTLEVGIMGYYSARTMIDFSGLIQPEIARQLALTGTYGGSTQWAIERYSPDYVVLDRSVFNWLAETGWFQGKYEAVRSFAGPGTLWLTAYRRAGAE